MKQRYETDDRDCVLCVNDVFWRLGLSEPSNQVIRGRAMKEIWENIIIWVMLIGLFLGMDSMARAQPQPLTLPPIPEDAKGKVSATLASEKEKLALTEVRSELAEPLKEVAEVESHEKSYRLEGFYLLGDYYLVRPTRQANDFAISSNQRLGVVNGQTQNLSWNTESGLKVAGGYQFQGGWDASISYFYVHSSGVNNAAAPAGGALYATLTNNTFDDVSTALSTGNLDYNAIDIEAGKSFQAANNLQLRVTGGGRIAWIDQQFSAIYNGGSMGALNDFVSSPVHFSGAGPTFGCEGVWDMSRHFGLYARGKGGILSGSFKTNLLETNNNGEVTFYNVTDKYQGLVPVVEAGIGGIIRKDHLHLKVGYELVNYFNMVNSLDFQSLSFGKVNRRMSDLGLEMLMIELGLTF